MSIKYYNKLCIKSSLASYYQQLVLQLPEYSLFLFKYDVANMKRLS